MALAVPVFLCVFFFFFFFNVCFPYQRFPLDYARSVFSSSK